MKNLIISIFFLTLITGFTVPSYSQTRTGDPGGLHSGVFRFGFGPGIPFYGSSGFGPAVLWSYDHNLWQAGPGTISLGGQIGTSFFSNYYTNESKQYAYKWVNLGFVFRGAYHYGWRVPGLDTYGGFGTGMVYTIFNNDGYDSGKKQGHVDFLPTAFLGVSYFFNNMVGINAEWGYDFAYASIGLSFRLTK